MPSPMLAPPDRDLVARDPALPGLETVLDPAATLAALRRFRPDLGGALPAATYVRYKPATSCLVGYRLCIEGESVLIGLQARRHDAWDKLAKVRDKPGVRGPLGPGRLLLPELAMAISVFPNDRRLPRLKLLADPNKRRRLISKLSGNLPELSGTALEVLHYRPERRCVARLVGPDGPLAVVKFHGKADFARAGHNASIFQSRGSLRIPDLIACSKEHRVVTSEWIAAEADKPNAINIGAALAQLHAQDAQPAGRSGRADQARALRALAHDLARLWPPLATKTRDLARRLSRALVDETGPLRPIHGDFYSDQILLSGDRVALIDFDEAVIGSPARDIGNFIGHLHYRDRLGGDVAAIGDTLLESYRRAGGDASDCEVRLQTALGLMRLATRPFRERVLDWPERMEAILDRVDALIDSRARAPAIDPAMPFLEQALDPAPITRYADLARLGPGDWRIEAATIVRHKPGRRCLIEYRAANDAGERVLLLGKVRARGADENAHDLQRQLWESGFGPGAAGGVCVPEPITIVPELGLWLQRKVPGTSFTDLLTPSAVPDAGHAAAAIAKLHACGVRPRRRHAMTDELDILRTRLSDLAQRRPDQAGRVRRLTASCEALGSRAEPVRARGIHRDFYPDHLLVDGEGLFMIDFDLFCEGDPAVDVGNFVAHVTEHCLRVHGDAGLLADWRRGFVNAYRRIAPDIPAVNIAIYELLSLARLAEIATRMPERAAFTENMLQLCEDRIAAELADWKKNS